MARLALLLARFVIGLLISSKLGYRVISTLTLSYRPLLRESSVVGILVPRLRLTALSRLFMACPLVGGAPPNRAVKMPPLWP